LKEEKKKKLFLRSGVEGEQVNCNPVSITLATLDDKHWAIELKMKVFLRLLMEHQVFLQLI
jgi:hypothetical protein